MLPRTHHLPTFILTLAGLLTVLLFVEPATAEPVKSDLEEGIVRVRFGSNTHWVTGAVIKSDPYNGYVVTIANDVKPDAIAMVEVSGRSTLVRAQVLSFFKDTPLVLLKVNGLNVRAFDFAKAPPARSEAVWTAVKTNGSEALILLSRGRIQNALADLSLTDRPERSMLLHDAIVAGASSGSILLNNCGEFVGYTITQEARSVKQAISASLIKELAEANGVRISQRQNGCVSAVQQARSKADLATLAAEQARSEALEAQNVANQLASQLQATTQKSQQLLREAARAQQTADAAIAAAAAAQTHAEQTRAELERNTASMTAETQALVQHLQLDNEAAEARFADALRAQQASANQREDILIVGFATAIFVLVVLVVLLQRFGIRRLNTTTSQAGDGLVKQPEPEPEHGPPRSIAVPQVQGRLLQRSSVRDAEREMLGVSMPDQPESRSQNRKPAAQVSAQQADVTRTEYILDGRDEEGIRHMVKISSAQLSDDQQVIIGRSPLDAPCLIDHIDVSRKHAQVKARKGQLFIEDLGSTNGTSVNGEVIDNKGPVSVSNGDQIIIGSVVMKLRVSGT